MAYAETPNGPWSRLSDDPILRPSDDLDDFDSMRVDDTCIVVRENGYWMYYKGRGMGRTPGETKMGLAISDSPTGPYVKHSQNPVLDSGHEVCVWPHGAGVGCLVANIGPQGNTLQYSEDEISFRKISDVVTPKASGPYREDNFVDGIGTGIRWGLSMGDDPKWPYLLRFDCELEAEKAAEAQ